MPLTGWTVIDSDGTLIPAPCKKEGAHGTFQGFLGHHVFAACDNTGEQLAATLHPGNVGANDAEVNIGILTRAVAQLPWWRRRKILLRVDGAGFSRRLIGWIASAGGRQSPTFRREYSVGRAVTARDQAAFEICDKQGVWQPAGGGPDGGVRGFDVGNRPHRISHRWRRQAFDDGLRWPRRIVVSAGGPQWGRFETSRAALRSGGAKWPISRGC